MFFSWVSVFSTARAIVFEEKPKLVLPPVENAEAVANVKDPMIVEAATQVVTP